MTKQKLTVKEVSSSIAQKGGSYKVVKMVGTVEWSIGDVLEKRDIEAILRRSPQRTVEITIQ